MRILAGALVAATVALTACSPGYRQAAPVPAPPPPNPSATHLLAEEDALRALITWPPNALRGALDRGSVRAGEPYRATGTTDCDALQAGLDLAGDADAPATVRARGDGSFTVDGVVPRGTAPQTAQVVIVTTCGPAERGALLALRLRVTG